MASISATPKLRTMVSSSVLWATKSITESPTAYIMMVVAVLEIHIDRNAVAIMKPRMIREGDEPTTLTILRAILRCRPTRCIPAASRKPPRNR